MKTPLQLVYISLAALLGYYLWIAVVASVIHDHPHLSWIERTVLLLPAILAISIQVASESRLRKGLKTDRWSPSEIEPARTWAKSRFASTVPGLGLVCLVIAGIIAIAGHHLPLVSMLSYPVIAAASQPKIFLPRNLSERPAVDLVPSAPISSQHWGEAPKHQN